MKTFAEFWPFYLREHRLPATRRIHFVGSTLSLGWMAAALLTQRWPLLWGALVTGYAFAWVGHFFIEHNRPATFRYPLWSLAADWKMWWLMLTRRPL